DFWLDQPPCASGKLRYLFAFGLTTLPLELVPQDLRADPEVALEGIPLLVTRKPRPIPVLDLEMLILEPSARSWVTCIGARRHYNRKATTGQSRHGPEEGIKVINMFNDVVRRDDVALYAGSP